MIFLLLPLYAVIDLLLFSFLGFGGIAYSIFLGFLSLVAIKARLPGFLVIAVLVIASVLFAVGLNGIAAMIGDSQSPVTKQVYRDGEFVDVDGTFPWVLSCVRFSWYWLVGGAGLYWNFRNGRMAT